jgi:hypothetical protein
MSQQQRRETNDTAPAEAINDFGAMTVRHVGGNRFRVVNLDSGTVSEVDLKAMTCTCEDMEYNQRADRSVCKHYLKAHYQAPECRLSVEEQFFGDLVDMTREMNDVIDAAEDAADALEGALVHSRDAEADAGGETSADADTDTSPPGRDIDAGDAAERLQTAYDDVVEDMQVQHHEGWVWVQTGRDTPDNLPGPGNVAVFEAFLQNPDAVEYVPEDHDDAASKPGEWWKNRIAPEAVDDYIQEVLE